eukprot:jgi/Botrbrau1/22785/Bobra.0132s0111.1
MCMSRSCKLAMCKQTTFYMSAQLHGPLRALINPLYPEVPSLDHSQVHYYSGVPWARGSRSQLTSCGMQCQMVNGFPSRREDSSAPC